MGAEGPDKKRVRSSNIVNVLLISCRRELRCVCVCVVCECVKPACVQMFACAGLCKCVRTKMSPSVAVCVCVCVAGVMSGYITAYCWVD